MKAIIRIVLGALLVLVLVAIALPLGLRTWSAVRETAPPLTGEDGRQTKQAGDTRLAYREWGNRYDPPILLIHGTLAWSETWHVIAPQIATAGYRVIAPDLPPFGYSQRPANADYGREAQAKRILAFADSLGLQKFHLVGHSFGGGATVETAFLAPARINGLVLLDVAMGWASLGDGPPMPWLLGNSTLRTTLIASTFTNPLMIGPGLRDFIEDDKIVTDDRIELYRRPLSVAGTSAAVGDWLMSGLFADETGSLAARAENYAGFEPPVLIVWGQNDTVTPLEQGTHLQSLFGDAQLSVLPNVNHIPHVEAPDAVARLIVDFLRSQRTTVVTDPETGLRPGLTP
jgi:2-hydroxymuconate-semialdehyde hydrolase